MRSHAREYLVGVFLSIPFVAVAAATHGAEGGLIGLNGTGTGTVELTETPNGVLVRIAAHGIAEGEHAVHLHETGACDAAGGFESAGDHFAPGMTEHGYLSAQGPHAGDLPNQTVGADGMLHVELLNEDVSLSGEHSLLDADGAALVIHAGADDYTSQPAGDSGNRIACAVLEER